MHSLLCNKKFYFTFLFLLSSAITFAQTGSIIGTVKTSDGSPAKSVNIALQGTTKGTTVNSGGSYVISNIKPGTYKLIASFTGLKTQIETVTITPNEQKTVDFILSENNQQLQEVIVGVSKVNKFTVKKSPYVAKMSLDKMENPQSYSVLSKELLTDQQIFTVDDALRNVAGLSKLWDANGRGATGGAFYTLRGFTTSAKIRNGVTGNVSSVIDAANLESVEVIKGPSATLFGNSLTSYGGLINRVTKAPLDTLGGSVTYAGGSYGLNRISADFNAPLTTEKNILFRLNTAYTTQNSFRDNGFNKNFSFAPSLTYKVNDKLSFNFDAEIYSGRSNNFQSIYFYPGMTVAQIGTDRTDKLNLDYYSSYVDNSLVTNSTSVNLFGQMNLEINNQWKLQTNISATNSSSRGAMAYFDILPNAAVLGDPAAKGADYLARLAWTPTGGDQSIEIQPNLTGDFKIAGLRNRLTIGLDYYGYKNDVVYNEYINNFGPLAIADFFDVVPLQGPSPNYNDFTSDRVALLYGTRPLTQYSSRAYTNTYSAYAVDVLNITDELIALASLRVDRFNNKGIYNPVTAITSTSYNQTSYSPKFGLVYQILPKKISLFGNYQNGFTNETGADYKGKTFKPEHANQLEGGIKLDLFDGKLSSTLSYYDIKVDDIIRSYPANPNLSIQDGTQKSKGFEAEVIANPVNGLNIIAGYAHNESKYINTSTDLNGHRPNTSGPADQGNAWISYRLSHSKFSGLGLGFGGNYAGKNYMIDNVSQGQFYHPAYTVLNSSLFYDKAKMRLGITINNFTNEKYWVGYGTINSQTPRNYVLSATFKF